MCVVERMRWYSDDGIARCVRQDAEVVSASCVIPLGVIVASNIHSFLRCCYSISSCCARFGNKQETIPICCSVGHNGSAIDRVDLATEFELRHSSLVALFFPKSW